MKTGYLYIISNKINDNVYVGITYASIKTRFIDHKKAACNKSKNTKLYNAMRELGIDNFSIQSLGEYKEDLLENKEIETIRSYNSYIDGYNSTSGGSGAYHTFITEKDIKEAFTGSLKETALNLGITAPTVKRLIEYYKLPLIFNKQGTHCAKRIIIKDMGLEFNSLLDCAKYLIKINITKALPSSICSSISRAIKLNKPYKRLNISYIENLS